MAEQEAHALQAGYVAKLGQSILVRARIVHHIEMDII